MKENVSPPKWVDALLKKFAPADLEEDIRGDLYEIFSSDLRNSSPSAARMRYTFNALGFLTKSFFWRRNSSSHSNPFIMLSNYFKMARRSLIAYKGTSTINIVGLVTGISAALVIAVVVQYELSFNKIHSDADRIYRMVRVTGEDMSEFRTGVSYPVPATLREEISAIEEITSMEYFGGAYVDVMDESGKSVARFREDFGCAVADPSFFKIFDFKDSEFRWLSGNPEKALTEPFSVVLTESIAKKYFGNQDPLGKTIRFEKHYDAKITGIITDLPPNTDFPFTVFVSYSSLKSIVGEQILNSWGSVNDTHQTFVRIPSGVTKSELEAQIEQVHRAHTSEGLHTRHYLLQELSEMHHDARFGVYSGRTISKNTVLALVLVGIFLLLTAAINYINLSTAQSAMRSKEIGLRKALGSYRRNLVGQFLTETFVVVVIAACIAVGIAQILTLQLHSLLNLPAGYFAFSDPAIIATAGIVVVAVTLFAGIYPSFMISRFSPIEALKNKFTSDVPGNISLRKTLVVLQFAVTQILVVGTFIVVSQIRFFQNSDMGFDRDAIINLNLPNTSQPADLDRLENELRSQSLVKQIAFSSTLPSGVYRNRNFMDVIRKNAVDPQDAVVFEYQSIDPSFIDLYKIQILAGRNLLHGDTTGNVLINKKLASKFGFGTPWEAVGQELDMSGRTVTIAGVTDDFYSNSLKEAVDYTVFVVNPHARDFCSIKIEASAGSMSSAIKGIEKAWSTVYPEHIFNYSFLDDNVRAFYAQEEKYAQLFELFTTVFIVIGCLGLYGLVTFAVNRKAKEVAIRKVLGASMRQILVMFSREYVLLIFVSFILAVPIAYFSVESWLSNFANHIPLNWWLFAAPGVFVLALALIVIVVKSLATANANPVEKLKYE